MVGWEVLTFIRLGKDFLFVTVMAFTDVRIREIFTFERCDGTLLFLGLRPVMLVKEGTLLILDGNPH